LHKQTNKQTNKQTDRFYENNGHLDVNQQLHSTAHQTDVGKVALVKEG